MKLVVVGASGNVGTAVLGAVADAGDIEEVVGVARRVPRETPPAPYDAATWVGVDVADQDEHAVVGTLARAMEGADAVVQLAWIVQPNHRRAALRRTNVLGTSRVLAAARAAGVGHVVVASSVAAYSPGSDDVPHHENWPTNGVPSSEYSVDKVAVELMLDEHERDHPEVLITRLRPALIFQRAAGSQIIRNFFGRLAPGWAFRGRLPLIPWPRGTRVQCVHADDVARAYLGAVRERRGGAFNIAADDVLGPPELAELLSGGRFATVPKAAMRGLVAAGWNTRVLPVSPGWIDLAAAAPVISTSRARDELGWLPRHSAFDTMAEVLRGIADGAGAPSPPLRPRRATTGNAQTRTRATPAWRG